MNPAVAKLLAGLVALALAFGAGWKVCDWRMTASANAEALQRAEAADKQRDKVTAERDALAAQLAAKDDQHLKDLQNAQAETNHLRDCLRDGTCGLHLAGSTSGLRGCAQTSAGSSVDNGAGAELDRTAQRAYFALRDGITIASNQLAACQDELRLRTTQ